MQAVKMTNLTNLTSVAKSHQIRQRAARKNNNYYTRTRGSSLQVANMEILKIEKSGKCCKFTKFVSKQPGNTCNKTRGPPLQEANMTNLTNVMNVAISTNLSASNKATQRTRQDSTLCKQGMWQMRQLRQIRQLLNYYLATRH